MPWHEVSIMDQRRLDVANLPIAGIMMFRGLDGHHSSVQGASPPGAGDDTFSDDGKFSLYSGRSAKVQTDPPCGTLSLSRSRAMFQYSPPMPDSTVTYCRP
jgi:hypothetical protein